MTRRRSHSTNRLGQSPWLVAASIVAGALLWAAQIPSPIAAPLSAQVGAATKPEYLTPVEIKLSADGKKLFVACEGNGSVLAVDTRTKQVVGRAKVGHQPSRQQHRGQRLVDRPGLGHRNQALQHASLS
ncbi:MAG: PQQ-binding-like beta-propeller repeat protein [Acidobacteriia bacterium]|nr:PQQ-binding-like beta-propeller repeat protein [Terriglobia bacterium]